MRHLLTVLPVLFVAVLAVPAAEADSTSAPACGAICARCEVRASPPSSTNSWYIGPKGGDIRRFAHAVVERPVSAPSMAALGSRPWYIGPKGGDIRRGTSPTVISAASASAQTRVACEQGHLADVLGRDHIGPKGGEVRRNPPIRLSATKISSACISRCLM